MEEKKSNTEVNDTFDPEAIVKCCLCGKEIPWRQSANPWPLVEDEESRCCHDCDERKVLPARWKMMRKQNPAFIEIGNKFVSATDEKGIEKATEYFFSHFLTAKEDRTDNVFRDILRKGFEKIGPGDPNTLRLWTGYMMAVCDMTAEESIRMIDAQP